MAAQSDRLSTVADNIANASTTGYKQADTEFSQLIVGDNKSSYSSGGVETRVRYGISSQGALGYTNSSYDLAISGNGFFVVSGSDDQIKLTRAGAFVPDGEGRLVNSAGYKLMGYPIDGSESPAVVVNGTAGLVEVDVSGGALEAAATTTGKLYANVDSNATAVAAAELPSTNSASAEFTSKTSVVVYDNVGNEVVLDVYYAKSVTSGQWELTVFNAADRDSSSGGFPYSNPALTSGTLTFDANGNLDPSGTTSLNIAVPNGRTVTLDVAQTTQLAADFTISAVSTDGNAPSEVASVDISNDGVVYFSYENGNRKAAYRIPLATVMSVDKLTPQSGNTYALSSDSGDLRIGVAGTGGLGSVVSGALEQSTVDLAAELTEMIESQRNYTANSRVFQTGAELLEVVSNLKR